MLERGHFKDKKTREHYLEKDKWQYLLPFYQGYQFLRFLLQIPTSVEYFEETITSSLGPRV